MPNLNSIRKYDTPRTIGTEQPLELPCNHPVSDQTSPARNRGASTARLQMKSHRNCTRPAQSFDALHRTVPYHSFGRRSRFRNNAVAASETFLFQPAWTGWSRPCRYHSAGDHRRNRFGLLSLLRFMTVGDQESGWNESCRKVWTSWRNISSGTPIGSQVRAQQNGVKVLQPIAAPVPVSVQSAPPALEQPLALSHDRTRLRQPARRHRHSRP